MYSILKKISFFLSLGILASGCGEQKASSKVLVLGTSSDNPPYEYFSTEHNKVTGFDIELAEKVAEELGAKLEVKDMDFNALIPAVSSGRIDVAMASITPTPERKKSVSFSEVYFEAKAAMLTRKGDKIHKTEDFAGKRVGVQMGSSHEAFVKEIHAKSSHFELVSRNKTGDLVQELKNNRIDVAVMEERPAMEYAKMDDALQTSLIDSSVITFAIALKKDSPKVAEINKALETLREKGEITRLEKKWLD